MTPDAIDAVLRDFRTWLEDLVNAPETPVADAPGSPAVDLATVVAAFTALRHEVNLQTKAARAQSEQLAKALEVLELPSAQEDNESAIRPFVKAVAEVFDTLTRTTTEMDRLREGVAAVPSVWRRWFGRLENLAADRIAATITGLRMSERRVERLMRQVGLEPVECVGRPFDPEMMEAVEAIAGGEHPAGTVIEELQRGYLWNGRAFRFAQVRVAK